MLTHFPIWGMIGLALGLAVTPSGLQSAARGAEAPPLQVATFRCDVTPPPGEPLLWATNLLRSTDALLAKGLILQDGTNRYALCALDWCLLASESERSFRQAIAGPLATDPRRVAIQCVHQHAAPYADEAAYHLLDAAPSPLPHLSPAFMNLVRARLATAAAEAMSRLEPCNQVGTGEAKVERVAATRRLKDERGRPLVRYSTSGSNPRMAEAPEGLIDPLLKTVTLARDRQPLARLHYYATHPQTFCCDGVASADFVGQARESLEQQEHVFQIYFTGCGSDVTVGKYNDGSPATRAQLTERLKVAMEKAIAATRWAPAEPVVWRTASVALPLRTNKEIVLAQSRGWLNDPKRSDGYRAYEGAMRLSFVERLDQPLVVSSLQMGRLRILHLPGEPMLEFQLFAQRSRPDDFVAVAGYGDCAPAYVCTDQAYADGGYESSASNVGPGSESALKSAILSLLGAPAPPRNLRPAAVPSP